MDAQQNKIFDLVLHAACGMPLVPPPRLLFNLLLSSDAALPALDAYGLQPNQICRVLLHAGAKKNQLQVRFNAAQASQHVSTAGTAHGTA
jgi:hypothetical protein